MAALSRSLVARIAGLMLVASLAGACGSGPAPTPEGMSDLLTHLGQAGASLRSAVSGDAGCADQSLAGNAVRLELVLAADGRHHTVYLLRWRKPSDYATSADAFSACVSEFAQRGTGPTVEVVEIEPWRAFGPGWSKELIDALRGALTAAATGE